MHDDQKTSDYPLGYTPMTDAEMLTVWNGVENGDFRKSFREIEQAVLSRLPKPDAEPVRWIVRTVSKRGVETEDCVNFLPSDGLIEYVTKQNGGPTEVIPLYAHPPQDTAERMEALDKLTKMAQEDGLYDDPPVARKETAEREPIAWFCKTKHGNGVSYSNKFWELHPDFYQGAQEPNPNTAERDALVRRIDEAIDIECSDLCSLFRDIRAYLTGGGA